MTPIRFAFAGFRHGHIMSLLERVRQTEKTVLAACCEEDEATRGDLLSKGNVPVDYDCFETMLDTVDCDAVAIGDYYGRRGSLAIRALEAGKHVIADKPLCTTLAELEQIAKLAAGKKLSVGCQLDMRGRPVRQTMRRLVSEGVIGEVLTVCFSAQHPRMLGTRPGWYFEAGKHGGTINDIGVHAMDWIPWLTGQEITEVTAARVWNGKTPEFPCFQDCGQLMLKLENGGGVIGDVSYLSPDRCGYAVRQYWRITLHGSQGMMECRNGDNTIQLATHDDAEPREIPSDAGDTQDYFRDFLGEIAGEPNPDGLTTAKVLRASRIALVAQEAGESGKTGIPV